MRTCYKALAAISLFALSFSNTAQAQTSWVKQSSPATENLSAIFFLDTEKGWSVGESGGAILKTTNGGESWTQLVANPGTSFYDIYFADRNKGWAVGQMCADNGCDGIIIYTKDGGASWTEQEIVKDIYFLSLFFINANTGWATSGPSGSIYKTTDGGLNWSVQETNKQADYYDSHFFDANTGVVVGYAGSIMRTTNGGASWVQQSTGLAGTFNGLHFINNKRGWAAGSNIGDGEAVLASTSDGGISWSTIKTVAGNTGFNDVKFIDENQGWVVGESQSGAVVYYTMDGGKNLQAQSHNTGIYNFKALEVKDANNAWISGDEGNILRMIPDPSLGSGDITSNRELMGEIYPNPGKSLVYIPLHLSTSGNVKLVIYDLSGRIMDLVLDQYLPAGKHTKQIFVDHLPEGIYLIKLESPEYSVTKKLVVK